MKQKLSPSSELRFDEEKHQYFRGNKRIPGVSEILKKVGLSKNYDGLDPFYRDRGKATHLAIQYFLEGRLDESSISDVVRPHFEAFRKFWGDRKERIYAIEKSMASKDDSFAGTPDLVTEKAIYDWKCSKSHDPVAELQGQAYLILALREAHDYRPTDLDRPFIVVELHDDGEFKEFNYGTGYEEWASVMDLYRWRIKK